MLPPPLQEPWNDFAPNRQLGFEVVGQDEYFEDVAAIEGWRRMMMRLHRLFYKRRCFAYLGIHLRSYQQVRDRQPRD